MASIKSNNSDSDDSLTGDVLDTCFAGDGLLVPETQPDDELDVLSNLVPSNSDLLEATLPMESQVIPYMGESRSDQSCEKRLPLSENTDIIEATLDETDFAQKKATCRLKDKDDIGASPDLSPVLRLVSQDSLISVGSTTSSKPFSQPMETQELFEEEGSQRAVISPVTQLDLRICPSESCQSESNASTSKTTFTVLRTSPSKHSIVLPKKVRFDVDVDAPQCITFNQRKSYSEMDESQDVSATSAEDSTITSRTPAVTSETTSKSPTSEEPPFKAKTSVIEIPSMLFSAVQASSDTEVEEQYVEPTNILYFEESQVTPIEQPDVFFKDADSDKIAAAADTDSMTSSGSDHESQISKPKRRASKLSIESQDPYEFSTQDSNEPDFQEYENMKNRPQNIHTITGSDGSLIKYTATRMIVVTQYLMEGEVVHSKEAPTQLSPVHSTSSGYAADLSGSSGTTYKSSGESSGQQSQPSQELVLKTHHSAEAVISEDRTFTRPKKCSSAPPLRNRGLKETIPKPISSSVKKKILKTLSLPPQMARNLASLLKPIDSSDVGEEYCASVLQDCPSTSALGLSNDDAMLKESNISSPEIQASSSAKENTMVSSIYERSSRKKRKRESSESSIKRRSHEARETSVSERPLISRRILSDQRVFAKWIDKYYYSGRTVVKASRSRKWTVSFDDGNEAEVLQSDIIAVEWLPVGLQVLAKPTEYADEYYPADIVQVLEKFFQYRVRFLEDSTETVVSIVDICLTTLQGKSLQQLCTDSSESDPSPVQNQPDLLYSTSEVTGARQDTKRRKIFTDIQTSPEKPKSARKDHAVASSSKMALFTGSTTEEEDESYNFFSGFVFIITCCKRDKMVTNSTTEAEGERNQDVEVQPLNKEELCDMIEKMGGVVISSYETSTVNAASKTYLLSDSYQRTVKYLECLAAGSIPPVNYQWVKDCHRSRKLSPVTAYMLPAGVEIINEELVEWRERRRPLVGWKIFLAANPADQFLTDWKAILSIAGASIIPKMSINSGMRPRLMLVSNQGCPRRLVHQARHLHVPMVSPEWAIQTLILGESRAFDEHASYCAAV